MSYKEQTSKFSRFIRNHGALLLLVFSIVAIVAVIIVVSLSNDKNKIVEQPVNVPGGDVVVDDTPTQPQKQTTKVYFAKPIEYTSVAMEYADGKDVLFVFNSTLNSWSTHAGVDLLASDGASVCAMYDGVVTEVSNSYGMGNVVKVDHGNNVVITYASLGNVDVVKGQAVKKGDSLGTVSTTASYEFNEGAHLHLEVAENGKNVDPMRYLDGTVFREVEID